MIKPALIAVLALFLSFMTLFKYALIASERNGQSPLHLAVEDGDIEQLSFLLKSELKNIDVTDFVGHTSLHLASSLGNVDIVKALLIAGANPNAATWLDRRPLHVVLSTVPLSFDIVEILIKFGADVNVQDANGESPSHLSVKSNSWKSLEKLISGGAKLYIQNHNGSTSLHSSCEYNADLVVKPILENFSTNRNLNAVNIQDRHGYTALHCAVVKGLESMVGTLLSHGADPHIRAFDGRTALHLAAQQGNVIVMEQLMKQMTVSPPKVAFTSTEYLKKQERNCLLSRDHSGDTALHVAGAHGHVESARLLLESILLLSNSNSSIDNSLNPNIAHNVKEHVNSRNSNGWTALHLAAIAGHADVIEFLLSQGADPTLEGSSGDSDSSSGGDIASGGISDEHTVGVETALHFACVEGHVEAAIALNEAMRNLTAAVGHGVVDSSNAVPAAVEADVMYMPAPVANGDGDIPARPIEIEIDFDMQSLSKQDKFAVICGYHRRNRFVFVMQIILIVVTTLTGLGAFYGMVKFRYFDFGSWFDWTVKSKGD